jgi:hypothetical protein
VDLPSSIAARCSSQSARRAGALWSVLHFTCSSTARTPARQVGLHRVCGLHVSALRPERVSMVVKVLFSLHRRARGMRARARPNPRGWEFVRGAWGPHLHAPFAAPG